ncbi:MAG: OmpA family protein [Pseudomonadota bacterium]
MKHLKRAAAAILLSVGCFGSPALAQSAEDIVRALLPAPSTQRDTQSAARSFRPSGTRGISISGRPEPAPARPSINLTINFEFDSARLTNDGWIALQALGQALADPRLSGMNFEIAGHTDGRGTPGYNLELSQRRADTVARHLALYYAVDATRLMPVGYGESRLVDPANPERDINRRVEVKNLSPVF